MTEIRTVAVGGATGNQGGALAAQLLNRGHRVRALTRRPGGGAARRLRTAGAEVLAADLADPATLEPAIAGADAVFVMATPFEAGPAAETRQAISLVDAALSAGIGHIVYSSVASADRSTGVPHFESKFAVEEHLRASGAHFTIIAPAMFVDMLLAPWSLPTLREGWTGAPLPPKTAVQRVAVADIGAFAALVIEQPERFADRRIEIAGDASSGAELAVALTRHAGREVRYVETPMEQAGGDDLVKMYGFLASEGYRVDIAALRREVPEIDWHDLEAWASVQDWAALLASERVAS